MSDGLMAPTNSKDFTVAIICALPLEADAVLLSFDERYDANKYRRPRGDTNAYSTGRIGRHYVVLVHMPEVGKSSAATAAAKLSSSFGGIQLALLVGVCGGVPFYANKATSTREEMILGDVVISNGLVEPDRGRQFPDHFRRKDTLLDNLGRPNQEIRGLLSQLTAPTLRKELGENTAQHLADLQTRLGEGSSYPGAMQDKLFESSYRHKHHALPCDVCTRCMRRSDPVCDEALELSCDRLQCENNHLLVRKRLHQDAPKPLIHIGTIASGDMVMKSGEDRDEIARKEQVIAFEMEGAGVWDNLPCIVIKGVCDYADSHKNKHFQRYAAATAAACAKSFLEIWNPATLSSEKPSFLSDVHSSEANTFAASSPMATQDQSYPSPMNASTPVFSHINSLIRGHDREEEPERIHANPAVEKTCLLRWEASVPEEFTSFAFSSNGRRLASHSIHISHQLQILRIWNVATGQLLQKFEAYDLLPSTFAISPDGSQVATENGILSLWDVVRNVRLPTITSAGTGLALTFSPDGNQIVTCQKKALNIWDVTTGAQLQTFIKGHKDLVTKVAFSADGRRLVSSSRDGTWCVWNAETGELLRTMNSQSGRPKAVAFSHDGRQLAMCFHDTTLQIWNAETGELLQTLKGHKKRVSTFAFLDGRRLISASRFDTTVYIWNAATGELLQMLEHHTQKPRTIALSSDGCRLVSFGYDKILRMYEL